MNIESRYENNKGTSDNVSNHHCMNLLMVLVFHNCNGSVNKAGVVCGASHCT